MHLGEVCLLTNDVIRLANFYKLLMNVDNQDENPVHQTIVSEETMLTIYNDGSLKNNQNQNICIAFTVENIDEEYQKIVAANIEIIEPPAKRPWGATNMSFYDPDHNMVYLRCFNNK